jgi:hypothetical protein
MTGGSVSVRVTAPHTHFSATTPPRGEPRETRQLDLRRPLRGRLVVSNDRGELRQT